MIIVTPQILINYVDFISLLKLLFLQNYVSNLVSLWPKWSNQEKGEPSMYNQNNALIDRCGVTWWGRIPSRDVRWPSVAWTAGM